MDEQYVKSVYPDAFDCYHTDHRCFKVYRMVGGAWVAISAGTQSKAEAWRDAAETIKRRLAEREGVTTRAAALTPTEQWTVAPQVHEDQR